MLPQLLPWAWQVVGTHPQTLAVPLPPQIWGAGLHQGQVGAAHRGDSRHGRVKLVPVDEPERACAVGLTARAGAAAKTRGRAAPEGAVKDDRRSSPRAPRSEWWMRFGSGTRCPTAISKASRTSSVRM